MVREEDLPLMRGARHALMHRCESFPHRCCCCTTTVQAPQPPVPQPSLVPRSPRCERMKSSSVAPGSALASVRGVPLR